MHSTIYCPKYVDILLGPKFLLDLSKYMNSTKIIQLIVWIFKEYVTTISQKLISIQTLKIHE